MTSYDSRPETYEHIATVRSHLLAVVTDLLTRAHVHDSSKLSEPELSVFNEFTPRLRESTYGSEEYKGFLEEMRVGLSHHYAANRHHPEHFADGIRGMSLLDLIEMLADWKAATLRHADGDLDSSITKNAERFKYGHELEELLRNTARDLGWL